jgi:hypothetical protein
MHFACIECILWQRLKFQEKEAPHYVTPHGAPC